MADGERSCAWRHALVENGALVERVNVLLALEDADFGTVDSTVLAFRNFVIHVEPSSTVPVVSRSRREVRHAQRSFRALSRVLPIP